MMIYGLNFFNFQSLSLKALKILVPVVLTPFALRSEIRYDVLVLYVLPETIKS